MLKVSRKTNQKKYEIEDEFFIFLILYKTNLKSYFRSLGSISGRLTP